MEWVLKIWFSGTRLEGKWNKAFFVFCQIFATHGKSLAKNEDMPSTHFSKVPPVPETRDSGTQQIYFFYKCNLRLQQLTRCEGIFFLHIFGQKIKNYLFSSLIFGRGNLSFGLFFISKTSGKRCKSNFRITNL